MSSRQAFKYSTRTHAHANRHTRTNTHIHAHAHTHTHTHADFLTIVEERQVVVVVEFFDFHFPGDFVAFGVVFESDGKVASLVEFPKRSRLRRAFVVGARRGRIRHLSPVTEGEIWVEVKGECDQGTEGWGVEKS